MDNKQKFIEFMKNDIFALDKELDFGIYKIFKKSQKKIDSLLEDIANVDEKIQAQLYNYLYNFFSLYYEGGDFGYTKRAYATFLIPYSRSDIANEIKNNRCSFESSNSFFYDGEESKFTWKTEESYYIKSTKYFNNIAIKIDDYKINFSVLDTDNDFDSKKGRYYRLIKAKKEGNKITLFFNISNVSTPKHSIYLTIRYLIDNNIQTYEYVPSKDIEEIPPKNTLFDNFDIKTYTRYLFDNNKSVFKNKEIKNEDEKQIHSINLYITKKQYAQKVYNKTQAKEQTLSDSFDFENKKDIQRLFENDKILNFFYKLDRGFNNFLIGIDSDYFIHKNLQRFLLAEMDKFIKNYILSDTDKLLSKEGESLREVAKIFKQKAEKLIDFLSAVEEFQKYIWEKRKSIKKTEFIISSNKIKDDNLLRIILTNEDQTKEWKSLGLCKNTPDIEELKQNPYPIDTKHFEKEIKYKILSLFETLEIDGILIKSENYQALKFLEPKFKEEIKCIYIDPPYNTGTDGFVYKDNYKEASWLSMMNDRLIQAKKLLKDEGVIFSSIDDNEMHHLKMLMDKIFKNENFIAGICHKNRDGVSNDKIISNNHNYIFFYAKKYQNIHKQRITYGIKRTEKDFKKFTRKDENGYYTLNPVTGPGGNRKGNPYYEVMGIKNYWRYSKEKMAKLIKQNKIVKNNNTLYQKTYKHELEGKKKGATTWWDNVGTTSNGTTLLKNLFADTVFNYAKPVTLLKFILEYINYSSNDIILDFFAGSGTTGDAVIRLNTENKEKRKFILVEINDYFDNVIIPRIKKVSFSTEWKNGKAQDSKGIGGIYQYLYLTQYEDIIEEIKIEIKNIDIESAYLFTPLKNELNKTEIKADLETLFNFIFHRGLNLKSIKKENNLLIGYCEEGTIVLGENGYLEDIANKFEGKVFTNLTPKNNINKNPNLIEIITSADFKGI